MCLRLWLRPWSTDWNENFRDCTKNTKKYIIFSKLHSQMNYVSKMLISKVYENQVNALYVINELVFRFHKINELNLFSPNCTDYFVPPCTS